MINATVEVTVSSIYTYEIDNVASLEEAEEIALGRFDDGDKPEDLEILDIETESYERED